MARKKTKTEKQKKLIKLMSDNLGLDKPYNLYQMFLKAGYSESVAKQQSGILQGIKDKINPLLDKLEEEREEILKAMSQKRSKANYAELSRALDIVIKNYQLLSGKATNREEQILDEDQINAIIARRTTSNNSSGQI